MSNEFPVEAPRSFKEFVACEKLQGILDPPVSAKIPAWFLWELVQAGAVFLVSFDGVGIAREPLGFVLALRNGPLLRVVAFGARRDLPPHLRREMLESLLEEILSQAEGQGVEEVLWPFDPLEPRWAEFFLEMVGAEAETYELRRDRAGATRYLRALASIRPEREMKEKNWKQTSLKSFFPVNTTRPAIGGREPVSWNLHLNAPLLVLEIPGAGLTALPRTLVRQWEEAWEALETYVDKGYALVGFHRQGDRAFLVLERKL